MLLGVNYHLPLFHKYRTFICMNITEKNINQFPIRYMVNLTLYVNKAFKDQVEKYFRVKFHPSTMSGINKLMNKDNTCVIALVVCYENKTTHPMKVFRV